MRKLLYMFAFIIALGLIYFFGFVYNSYTEFDRVGFQNFIRNQEIQTENDLVQAYFLFKKYDFVVYNYEFSPLQNISITKKGDTLDIEFSYILRDDSTSKKKILISIDKTYKNVYFFGGNWKCRKGRGHQYWSSQKCY